MPALLDSVQQTYIQNYWARPASEYSLRFGQWLVMNSGIQDSQLFYEQNTVKALKRFQELQNQDNQESKDSHAKNNGPNEV